jgi:hypothetical protein
VTRPARSSSCRHLRHARRRHLSAALAVTLGLPAVAWLPFRAEPVRAQARPPALETSHWECVSLDERLAFGARLTLPLPRGLELRVEPEGDGGWRIAAGLPGQPEDFIWPVSPPFRTAPHRSIGPVYGLTPAQSAELPRNLRFVLTIEDYRRLTDLIAQNDRGEIEPERLLAEIGRVTAGSLRLSVPAFGLRESPRVTPGGTRDAFEWVRLEGEACVPPDAGDPLLEDVDRRLAPIAAWRARTEEDLRPLAGTAEADARLLARRLELKALVAEISKPFDTPAFQRAIGPDGAAGQGYRRAQGQPIDAGSAEVARGEALMDALRVRGVWPDHNEGVTYFDVNEAAVLEWFGGYLTDAIRQFLRLWADEQEQPTAEDASIQIPLEELERRIDATARYLADFPHSPVREPVQARHLAYLSLYLGGTDNSRAFDYRSDVMPPERRQRLAVFAAARREVESGRITADYLKLLEATGFRRTPAVRQFLEALRSRSDWRLRAY